MALSTGQQAQADTMAVSAPKYPQEIRTAESTDLTASEKAQVLALANLSYPLADPASGYDDYVAEIRTPGSTGLSAGIKARIASASTLLVDFVPALRSTQTAPAVVSAPIVLGTPRVGTSTTHTAGSFTGAPTPTISYQWLADDVAISGATSATYTPVLGDIGAVLKVTETATNAAGSIASTSAGSPAVVEASATLVFSEDWSTVPDWEAGLATQPPPPSSSWDAGYYGAIRFVPESQPQVLPPGQVVGDAVKAPAIINTSTNVIASESHGQTDGTKIWLSAATLPTSSPQVAEDVYSFVISSTTDTFKLSDTLGGTEIDFTTTGTTVVWNAANPLWFRSEGGRSWVSMVESYPTVSNGGYNTDVQTIKDITPTTAVYCSAWIKFAPGFSPTIAPGNTYGHVKMLRVAHWNGSDPRSLFFSGGNYGPIMIWDWQQNKYNLNSTYSIRGAPQATNYFVTTPPAANYHGRGFITGDISQNFTFDAAPIGPAWIDQVSGGALATTGIVSHNQVYGDDWNFMEWYLKLNSAPGVEDGELSFWLRGEQQVGMGHIPWLGDDATGNELWNVVMLGGNARYSHATPEWTGTGSPDQSMHTWWACSDFEIHNALPAGKAMRIDSGPNANYP